MPFPLPPRENPPLQIGGEEALHSVCPGGVGLAQLVQRFLVPSDGQVPDGFSVLFLRSFPNVLCLVSPPL